jgi:hypothetical protein
MAFMFKPFECVFNHLLIRPGDAGNGLFAQAMS